MCIQVRKCCASILCFCYGFSLLFFFFFLILLLLFIRLDFIRSKYTYRAPAHTAHTANTRTKCVQNLENKRINYQFGSVSTGQHFSFFFLFSVSVRSRGRLNLLYLGELLRIYLRRAAKKNDEEAANAETKNLK